MSGAGVVTAASLTLTPGNADDKQATVQFNGGGTINISGNVTARHANCKELKLILTAEVH
jgi:hypothetical protein